MPDIFTGQRDPFKATMPDMTYNDPWKRYDENPWTINNPAGTTNPLMDVFSGVPNSSLYKSIMQYNPFSWALPAIDQATGWGKASDQRMAEINQGLQHDLSGMKNGYPDTTALMPVMPESGYNPNQYAQQIGYSGGGQGQDLLYRQPSQGGDALSYLRDLAPGYFGGGFQNGMGADDWLNYINNPQVGDQNMNRPGGL